MGSIYRKTQMVGNARSKDTEFFLYDNDFQVKI